MALGGKNFYSRKRRRKAKAQSPLLSGVIGAAIFLVSVGGAIHFLSAPSDAGTAPRVKKIDANLVEILVPIDTLAVGTGFQPPMFRKQLKAYNKVTGDMIRSFEDLKGQYAKSVLVSGQPILKAALTNRQPIHVLTAMLPPGYRAVALQVQRPLLDNVDGWAQPGTDVDVIWLTSAFGQEAAAVLAGPVKILAANRATEWTPEKKDLNDKFMTVTLLLNSQDAVRVMLASLHGEITLGLRGLGDKKPHGGDRPVSAVVEDAVESFKPRSLVSVTIKDPLSRDVELRTYDTWGRRVSE